MKTLRRVGIQSLISSIFVIIFGTLIGVFLQYPEYDTYLIIKIIFWLFVIILSHTITYHIFRNTKKKFHLFDKQALFITILFSVVLVFILGDAKDYRFVTTFMFIEGIIGIFISIDNFNKKEKK